ncbi:MAG: molecular chaperone TorD family protein [Magnetococcales bacterium]|nr:molecular chaperone TorD family protein [Magnetococcales bacterium]
MIEPTQETTTEDGLTERLEELLRTAAMFRLLAMGFAYPADGQHAAVLERMGELQLHFPHEVLEAFHALRGQWEAASPEHLEEEHCRLFQGRKLVSLHETSYGDARRIGGQPVELSDISGFYRAFGMQLAASNPDMPDHLCTELEFYSLLMVKQAYAADQEWAEEEAITADASGKFLELHMGRWLTPMLTGLREHGAGSVYAAWGDLLERVVNEECRRRAITPQPFSGPVPHDDLQADQFTCPMAAPPPAEPEPPGNL